jgi:putative copper resistance protein D
VAAQLLDIFGFVSVLLRGAVLGLNSLLLGGVGFLTIVHPIGAAGTAVRRLIHWSAMALVVVEICYVAADSAVLVETAGLGLGELVGANFAVAGLAAVCASIVIAILTVGNPKRGCRGLLIPATITLSALVMTSHAAGRLEHRPDLVLLTALHQGATATWIGGLPYLLLALRHYGDDSSAERLCSRFSHLAMVSVALLVGSGAVMSRMYVGSVAAIYGTSYGAMVAAKVVLLAMVLCLGGLNFLIVHRRPATSVRLMSNLRRFAEAEVGIGFTVILAAASLTSQPPAVDLPAGPVSAAEVAQRMRPRWPRLHTPALDTLSPATPLDFSRTGQMPPGLQSFVPGTSYQPSTPGDIAWSEYNHHWAGLIVLTAGLLAVVARSGYGSWARHWPLVFLGLAVFLLLRADPENWPLGPRSFWQSFAVADVLQHRFFMLLIVAFAGFEWGVRTGRIVSQSAGLVFPGVCAMGGALLLTHTHSLSNINGELLMELSHLPLAICAVAAGWSRWLELRLAAPQRQTFAWIWPLCFVLIGVALLNYREA